MDKTIEDALKECESALARLKAAILAREGEGAGGWEITEELRAVPSIPWDGMFTHPVDWTVIALCRGRWDHYAYHPDLSHEMDGKPLPDHLRRSLVQAILDHGLPVSENARKSVGL